MISRAIITDLDVQPGSHCPDTRPAGRPTPAAEAFAFFAGARVRHYVPVLAFKRASGQLSERLAALGEEGGET